PAGYTFTALAGAMVTDGTASFRKFIQYGHTVQYSPMAVVVSNGINTTPTSISLAQYVPPNAFSARVLMNCYPSGGGNYGGQCFLSVDGTANATVGANYKFDGVNADYVLDSVDSDVLLQIPQTLYYYASQGNGALILNVRGFTID